MPLTFTKMHGLGNDYVFVSTFDQRVSEPERLAVRISDRHRGVGGDGLILVAPSDTPDAHVRMVVFNADGSRAEMCGNGIRCLAKLAYERGLARVNPLRVQTDRGVLPLALTLDERDQVREVCVDMGTPVLEPQRIPVRLPGERVIAVPFPLLAIDADDSSHPRPVNLALTAVSMGNPHAVFFVGDVAAAPLAEWGPLIERHELFPERTNVHFVQALAPDRLRVRTWERGAGATQACGTGAAAVCVAGALNGLAERTITAELPGGELKLMWDTQTDHVLMTGPAEEVFTGEWLG